MREAVPLEIEEIRIPTERTSKVYAKEQQAKVEGESTNIQTPNGKEGRFRISG